MADLVHYSLANGVATIQLDDGKRNALSPEMFRQIYAAFDRAEADRAIVILTGREQVFSAGFDLKVMKGSPLNALRMLRAGYSLTARVLAYPYPVIAACNGHALAMGVFLMLSADYVIGTRGEFRISANEVAIGMTMPRVAAAMLRHRLRPADFQTAVTLAKYFPVEDALKAGFFDELAETTLLMLRARELAAEFAKLNIPAHTASKRRIRRPLIRYIRRSVPLDLFDALLVGVKATLRSKP
ncbi:MAG TPA: crotonase/enoyl-CoA hydratase family protein [Burkholderiaceae bacterium]|jgi:enoyl-CoA hydratase|nr:crotonase/enoyl-CoA hydratase family protein [Burkholderiaceae bacterium]